MQPRRAAWITLALALLCAIPRATTQTAPQSIPQTTQDALQAITQLAGVIFTGQVTAIRRHEGVNGATGIVEIDFAVDDAIRGATSATFTLREWAGLWPVGNQPFRVGQRFLMLLHAPGPTGLSSPAGGQDGAIPIRGNPPKPPGSTNAAQPDTRTVDLRWIAARAVRPLSYAPPLPGHPAAPPLIISSAKVLTDVRTPAQQANSASTAIAPPPASDSLAYATVLALLRSWEQDWEESAHAVR